MAQQYLPSPPSSRPSSPSLQQSRREQDEQEQSGCDTASEDDQEQNTSLSSRLDTLLAAYLDLLETYTTLRAQLSKDFSSGFFALAQANRTSTLGPGRRYGEEGYDERMKASRTVTISPTHKSETMEKQTRGEAERSLQDGPSTEKKEMQKETSPPSSADFPRKDDDATTTKISNRKTEEHGQDQGKTTDIPLREPQTRRASPLPLTHCTSQSPDFDSVSASGSSPSYRFTTVTNAAPTDGANSSSSSKPLVKDPLKWYGILTPPYLRQCQSHFASSANSTIPEILSTISSLHALEQAIWLARQELGILDEYESENDRKAQNQDQNEARGEKAAVNAVDTNISISSLSSPTTSTKTSNPKNNQKKHSTHSKVSEPKPQVLKLE